MLVLFGVFIEFLGDLWFGVNLDLFFWLRGVGFFCWRVGYGIDENLMNEKECFWRILGEDLIFEWVVVFIFWLICVIFLYFLVVFNNLCNENFFLCFGENCKGEIEDNDCFWGGWILFLGLEFLVSFGFEGVLILILVKDFVLVSGFWLVEWL